MGGQNPDYLTRLYTSEEPRDDSAGAGIHAESGEAGLSGGESGQRGHGSDRTADGHLRDITL